MSDHLPESFSLAAILPEQPVCHQEGLIGQGHPRNEPHKTQDYEPPGRAILLGSLTLLLSAQAPLPNNISCFVSARVSPRTVHFRVLDKSPILWP